MDKIFKLMKALDKGELNEYILEEIEHYSDAIGEAIGLVAAFEVPAVIYSLGKYLEYFEKYYPTEKRVADEFKENIKSVPRFIKTEVEVKCER